MVYLRNIDGNQITLSVKVNKTTGKKEIFVNPSKTKKVPLKGQLGDDEMENPVRPLKAPASFENSDPDRPSIFSSVDDSGTETFFRTFDKVLPQEMERLGLAGEYPPTQYRPTWVEPAGDGQSGAVSVKTNIAGDSPCTITKLVDDGNGGFDQVEARSQDIRPGAVQAMYYNVSFSKIWKVKKEWGCSIWANEIVIRSGDEDDDMVLPGKKDMSKTTKRKRDPEQDEKEDESVKPDHEPSKVPNITDADIESEPKKEPESEEPVVEPDDKTKDDKTKKRRHGDTKKAKRHKEDSEDEE